MADDIAKLTAVMEANLKGFTKGMDQAQAIADKRFNQIEARMNKTEKRFNSAFGGLSHIGEKIAAIFTVREIERFVETVVSAASAVKHTSDALGVSAEALQEWGVIAGHAGVDQEKLTVGLGRFGKALGEAQIKGGAMAKFFKSLGVDATAPLEESFLKFADAVAETANQEQRINLVTTVFGRNSANMVAFIQQGSASIRAQGDELKRTGKIMTDEVIDKIHEMEIRWKDLKRQLVVVGANVLAGFSDGFNEFADTIESPAFQQGLRSFGSFMAEIAKDFALLAVHLPELAHFLPIIAGFRLGGVRGAIAGGILDIGATAIDRQTGRAGESDTVEFLQAKLKNAEARAASEKGFAQTGAQQQIEALKQQLLKKEGGGTNLPFVPKDFIGGKFQAGIDRTGLAMDDKAKEIAKSAEDAQKAASQLVIAIGEANVELERGTLASFDTIRTGIDNRLKAELDAIESERKANVAAKDSELNDAKILQADYDAQIVNIDAEAASKSKEAAVKATQARVQNFRDEFEARYEFNQKILDSQRELETAQNDAFAERYRGTEDYYRVAQAASARNQEIEEGRIKDQRDHFIEAIDIQNNQIEAAGLIWAEYEKERAAKSQTYDDQITALREKGANDRLQIARDEFESQFQLSKSVSDQRRDTINSEHDLILERAKGTQDYYKIAQELADESTALQIKDIEEQAAHDKEVLDKKKIDIEAAGGIWKTEEEERAAVTQKAELEIQKAQNAAAADRIRNHEEETRALEYQIQIMDQVRGGLEDVFIAGTHGFKSLKEAALSFVEQLAEMALRLYVIRPILESVFGRAGTTGGGLFGGLVDSIFGGGGQGFPDTIAVTPGLFPGRAGGGNVVAGRGYLVGEHHPEVFVPGVSGTVLPKIPSLQSVKHAAPQLNMSFVNQNSFAGAVDADSIRAYADQVGVTAAKAAIRTIQYQIPGLMIKAKRDNF